MHSKNQFIVSTFGCESQNNYNYLRRINKIEGIESLIENFNQEVFKKSRCNLGSFCIIVLSLKDKCG
jgi:hypothetical protein